MKKLVMIGGAMGIGKTTVTELLVNRVGNSIMLDGDWCWQWGAQWWYDAESKAMVMDNICHLLENFLRNSHVEQVFFCWVLHLQSIYDEIITTLRSRGCEFEAIEISLQVQPEELYRRLERRSIENVWRRNQPLEVQYERAMQRAACCDALTTHKVDTTALAPAEVAQRIAQLADIPWPEE